MPNPDKPDYTHGSTGTEPGPQDYQNGDPLDANNFDYYINELFETVKDIVDQLNVIDSDGDGVVDEADYANDADASTYKSNDIDTNGNGIVDNAEKLDDKQPSFYTPLIPANPTVNQEVRLLESGESITISHVGLVTGIEDNGANLSYDRKGGAAPPFYESDGTNITFSIPSNAGDRSISWYEWNR